MTTSIKVEDSTKRKIDKIQAQLLLQSGKKVTQQQLIELMADWATQNLETLKNILLDNPIILTDEEITAYKKYRISTGIKTNPQTIDQILYGE
ncbi:MAG: hypothetical protein ACE5R6_06320 [Candidatus Heimdallarchaeota archaeon]